MIAYCIRRTLVAIPMLWGAVTLVFVSVRLIPGDPITAMLFKRPATTQDIARLRAFYGLNKPLPEQYWDFLTKLVHLDFGRSIQSDQPVWGQIMARLPYTVELAVAGMVLATVIGLITGVVSARWNRTKRGTALTALAVLGISIPDFWLGTMLALVFGVKLGWLPVATAGGWKTLVLPATTLAIGIAAVQTRLIRTSLVDVLHMDYIRTARAKGLRERAVVHRHALRNAMIPVITILGLTVANLLGGVVIIENVFGWPGIGTYAVDAVGSRDFPAIQATTFLFALIIIVANLLVDLSYGFLDPRIRYS
jgi:peptide/nickel transport system permease protein